MEPLGYVGHGKSCFGPFGNGVSVNARQVHGFAPDAPSAQ
jgi:hypothetical protein